MIPFRSAKSVFPRMRPRHAAADLRCDRHIDRVCVRIDFALDR